MRARYVTALGLLLAAFLWGACGEDEADGPFPMELVGENRLFHATLSPVSEPLVVGSNDFDLTVIRAEDQAPAEGLAIEVVPWMPHHDHGAPTAPSVEEVGGGRYRIRGVAFNMEGEWELRISVSQGEIEDRFVAAFRV